jgi:hypothetical protein
MYPSQAHQLNGKGEVRPMPRCFYQYYTKQADIVKQVSHTPLAFIVLQAVGFQERENFKLEALFMTRKL